MKVLIDALFNILNIIWKIDSVMQFALALSVATRSGRRKERGGHSVTLRMSAAGADSGHIGGRNI